MGPWSSNDPHLSGNFAPVESEIEANDLAVVVGRIPDDLSGAYVRNGPNPQFEPLSYTYPLDGDGMIHAVYFDNGRARYKNRFVMTAALRAERRAGRALYGSVMHPVPVDPALLDTGADPSPFKSNPFINVGRFGGRLLAFGEVQPAYELSPELETIGEWTAGTASPVDLGAHNRVHPKTGETYAICYSAAEPAVRVLAISPDGTLHRTFPVALEHPSMIHDFVVTEGHIAFVIGPAVFDLAAAAEGRPFLQWRPEFGTRVGVVSLDGTGPVWIDTGAFWVFHFANGFERGGGVVLDYVRHHSLNLGHASAGEPPALHRLEIDLVKKTLRDSKLAPSTVEFPRIDDSLQARPSRFVYLSEETAALEASAPPSGTFDALLKLDTETGTNARHDFGRRIVGEAVFVPRASRDGEDDGYLAVFAYDPVSDESRLVLLDAEHIDADPVCEIAMPQRVPQGLHGNWLER